MRVLIAGAGAIGSAVGGSLALAGHHVALLGRRAYVEQVRERGVVLVLDGRRCQVGAVVADTEPGPLIDAMGGVDLAIVTTKVYDTEQVCRAVRDLAATLVLQNGMGGDAIAAGALGDVPIVAGVITWVVSTDGLGEYTVRSRRRGLGLAPYTATGALVDGLTRTFRQAGMRCRAYDDARTIRWSKLLLNVLGNAVPAILDLPPSEVLAQPELYALERAAFLEALAVMRAEAIPAVNLPGYPVRALVGLIEHLPERISRPLMARLIAGGRSGKAPSLQIDVQRGRSRSEVTALNGAVMREGKRLGVPTPANAAVYETLLGIVAGEVPREDLARNPVALIARAKAQGWHGP